MRADDLLRVAIRDGAVIRSTDVSASTHPDAARTYLSDGTGMAWLVPENVRGSGGFVIDAEIPVGVRRSLVRRYGIDDPAEFAQRWTRAEALAKLDDLPIITWISRHGLDVPDHVSQLVSVGEMSWKTVGYNDTVLTFAVRVRG